jgi:uncharacterized membrane protein YfcA
VYGPVCTVVWEGEGCEAFPYPDFLNNLFKLILVGRYTEKSVVLQFGVPAILFAYLGARTLILLSGLNPLASYHVLGKAFEITPVKLVIAVLLIVFAMGELLPGIAHISFEKRYLPLGGALSGFFGGLSGHQGALRSPFLLKAGLARESYIATGVVIACLVDLTRLGVYGSHFSEGRGTENLPLLATATVSAFLGAFLGSRFMKQVTMHAIQVLVAVMLLGIAVGLGLGLI